MMTATVHIVPAYAGALALLFICLSILVVKQRRFHRVPIGDGHKPSLKRAIAVHNNFAQYVPMALLLLLMMELSLAPSYLVHALCVVLVIARCAHAYGVSQDPEPFKYRKYGMISTFGVLALAAFYLIYTALFA